MGQDPIGENVWQGHVNGGINESKILVTSHDAQDALNSMLQWGCWCDEEEPVAPQ